MTRTLSDIRILVQLLLALLCLPACAAGMPQGAAKPFLVSTLSSSRPFVGEEILLTYTLYFRDTAPKISGEVTPSLRGLWVKEAKPERFIRSTSATYRGEPYRCAVIKRFRLVPLQGGKLTVSGYSMNCSVPAGKTAAGGTEPPDITTGITAPAVTLDARPLPGSPPSGYSGAVGVFTLELQADKQKVHAGEPITLKVQVSGRGSLLTLAMPSLRLPESFRRGTPEITSSLKSESDVSSGSTTSATMVWPQIPGNFTIPPLHMEVFDLQTGKFRSIESGSLTLSVEQPLNNTPPAVKPESGTPSSVMTGQDEKMPFKMPFSFIAPIAALLLAGAAIFFMARKRQAPVKREKEAEALPEIGDTPQEVKKMIFDFIEKAGVKGAAGLTRRELQNELQKKTEISPDQLAELTGILDAIDRILFTSSAGKEGMLPGDLAGKIERLQRALSRGKQPR
ncbi:MAG: hypothetical protein HGA70_03395 [Chlorobiaceae bacterium]|nr:hypothetical protein [Chlorobiaceae bacterium]